MLEKFLGGLSHENSMAKINIITSDEMPDLSEAFHRLNKLSMIISHPAIDSNSSMLVALGGHGRENFTSRGGRGWRRGGMYRGKM